MSLTVACVRERGCEHFGAPVIDDVSLMFLAFGQDGVVRLWHTTTGDVERTLVMPDAQPREVTCFKFRPTDKYVGVTTIHGPLPERACMGAAS